MAAKGDPPCKRCKEDGLAWWDKEPCHAPTVKGTLCHRPVDRPQDFGHGLVFYRRCSVHWDYEPKRDSKPPGT